jgi:hypothetical protein
VGMRRFVTGVLVALSLFGVVVVAPAVTPLLPPQELRGYLTAIGFSVNLEKGKMNEALPQWIGDRLGWKELVVDVAQVYHSLPLEEQKNAVIVSMNYGDAGALEIYGPDLGLPPVFCTHNSYHLWGPPSDSAKVYIGVHVSRRDFEKKFESVVEAAVHTCADCTGPQQRIPIYVARGPKFSVEREWPKFKIYD